MLRSILVPLPPADSSEGCLISLYTVYSCDVYWYIDSDLYPSPSNCLLCFPPYLHSGTVQPLWSALPEDLDTFLPFYSLLYCVQHPLPLSNIERREEEIRGRQHTHEQCVVWSTSEATGQPHLDCIFMFVTPYKWTNFIEFWKCHI